MEKRVIHAADAKAYHLIKSRREIKEMVAKIAEQIKRDYPDETSPPILLFVAKGGIYFGVDLSRALERINFPHSIDMVQLKRNYPKDKSEVLVNVLSWPQSDLSGRHVIVVEDLIDEGITMNFLYNFLKTLNHPPLSIEFCTLFVKEHHEALLFNLKYSAWKIGPNWLIGNGMDSQALYRGLPDVYQSDT